jgi:hypothetical protein
MLLLCRYLRRLELGYQIDVPYHNAAHAADVLQRLSTILDRCGLFNGYDDSVTRLSCLFAAVSQLLFCCSGCSSCRSGTCACSRAQQVASWLTWLFIQRRKHGGALMCLSCSLCLITHYSLLAACLSQAHILNIPTTVISQDHLSRSPHFLPRVLLFVALKCTCPVVSSRTPFRGQ